MAACPTLNDRQARGEGGEHTLEPEGGRGAMTSDETLNVIVANSVMIKACQASIPSNGKPWPDGAKAAKIQYITKKNAEALFNVAVPPRAPSSASQYARS